MAPLAWVHSFFCFHCPLPQPPPLYETGKDPRGQRGPGKEECDWGAQRGQRSGDLQGERKDKRDGEREKTREPRSADGRGLK